MTLSDAVTGDDNAYTDGDKEVVAVDGGVKFPSGDVVKLTDGTLAYDAEKGVYVFTRTKNGTIKFTVKDGAVTKVESIGFRLAKNNGVFTLPEEEILGQMTIEEILAAMSENVYQDGSKKIVAVDGGIKFPSNNVVKITEGTLTYDADEDVYVFTRAKNGTILFTVKHGVVTKVESINFKTAKNNGEYTLTLK